MDIETKGLVEPQDKINDSPTILEQMIFSPDGSPRPGVMIYQNGVKIAFMHTV